MRPISYISSGQVPDINKSTAERRLNKAFAHNEAHIVYRLVCTEGPARQLSHPLAGCELQLLLLFCGRHTKDDFHINSVNIDAVAIKYCVRHRLVRVEGSHGVIEPLGKVTVLNGNGLAAGEAQSAESADFYPAESSLQARLSDIRAPMK